MATRLFPYSISYQTSNIIEKDTTINSVTLESTNTSNNYIQYTIPCPYGETRTIEFDYTTTSSSIYFQVLDTKPNPDVELTEKINKRNTTSGHVTLEFTNNGGGNLDHVSFYFSTYRVATTTLSNFTVTEPEESGINLIRLGSVQPTAFYLGETQITAIYLGENVIYKL